jgi:molecular chaperone HscB
LATLDDFPGATASCLDVLGVGAAANRDQLAAALRERSRRWHPDRFALDSPEVRDAAEWACALANDAFRVLADPFDRAAYLLLRHRGVRPDGLKSLAPASLFAEMLEIQEQVEEVLDRGDAVAGSKALSTVMADVSEQISGLSERLRFAFTEYDSGAFETALDSMAEVVAVHGYLRRAADTVQRALSTFAVAD